MESMHANSICLTGAKTLEPYLLVVSMLCGMRANGSTIQDGTLYSDNHELKSENLQTLDILEIQL